MTDHTPAHSDKDARFEGEALSCLDDVYRFALSLTRDGADAEDLVQETFLRAYRSWSTYRAGSDCRKWLFTICRNAFTRLRERERHQVQLDDGDIEAFAAVRFHWNAQQDGSDALLLRMDLVPAIELAFEKLPEPFRSVVVLVDLEDSSYEVAAEILEIPIGTVRSRLFRGRRFLQEILLERALDAGITGPPTTSQ